jgi:hypothetical protein
LSGSAGEPARAQHPSTAPRPRRRPLDPNDDTLTPKQFRNAQQSERRRAKQQGRDPAPWATLTRTSTRRDPNDKTLTPDQRRYSRYVERQRAKQENRAPAPSAELIKPRLDLNNLDLNNLDLNNLDLNNLDPNNSGLTPRQITRLRQTERDRAEKQGRAPASWATLKQTGRRRKPPPAGRDDGEQSPAGYPTGPASDPGVLAVTGGMQVMSLTASSPLPPGPPAPPGQWAATAQAAASSTQNQEPQPSPATSRTTPYRPPSPTPAPRGRRR